MDDVDGCRADYGAVGASGPPGADPAATWWTDAVAKPSTGGRWTEAGRKPRWVRIFSSIQCRMRAIGRPEMAEGPRYARNVKRVENEGEIGAAIAAWTGVDAR